MFKKVCLFSGNANPALAAAIGQYLETPARQVPGHALQRRRELRRDRRERPRRRRLRHPADEHAHERQRDGAAHHGRRAPARLGRLDHRGHPLLRLRPAGPQGRAAHAHHEQARGGPHPDRRASTASSRSTCTPGRSRASSTSPSTTSTRCRSFSRTTSRSSFDSSAVFVSPDAGGVERTRAYSKRLGASLAIIDKRRERANVSEVVNLIGEVKGKDCIIIDDIIDTAGTLCGAARALAEKGARSVVACATHGVLSGPAVQRIAESPLTEVVVSDSIPLSDAREGLPEDQAALDRPPPRRGHQAHPQLGQRQLAVRLRRAWRGRSAKQAPPHRTPAWPATSRGRTGDQESAMTAVQMPVVEGPVPRRRRQGRGAPPPPHGLRARRRVRQGPAVDAHRRPAEGGRRRSSRASAGRTRSSSSSSRAGRSSR